MYYSKQIKIGSINTSEVELKDLLKAWLAISFAFAILFSGGLSLSLRFYYVFIVASLTVGVGFIVHELAHKLTAQHFGCFAEFRSFDMMLILAVAMSFLGFVFAAPGAVMISGPVGKRRNGKISMAGPLANIILALVFFSLFFVPIPSLLGPIILIGFFVNSLLALFNLIPLGNFDGRKILNWSKTIYTIMVIIGVVLFFLSYNFYIKGGMML